MIVLATLGMTMLLSVSAIVIDLGRVYVSARQTQNATDAAAMAGANTLDAMNLANTDPVSTAAAVDAVVMQIATRNGADGSLVACTWITWTGAPTVACGNPVGVRAASGVQVSAVAVNQTIFAKVMGRDTMRLERMAAATVQPLVGQDAPLLVCAFGQTGSPAPPNLLLPVVPFVAGGPAYVINPLAVSPDNGVSGPVYKAHAPHVADCGLQGSSWKGVAGEGPFVLPDWLPIATGVKAGPTRSQIAGQPGCGTDLAVGCVLVLPVCSGSNGGSGSNGQMFCDMFGAFKLVAETSNTQQFRLLGAAEATIGLGGNGAVGDNDVRVIRLIR